MRAPPLSLSLVWGTLLALCLSQPTIVRADPLFDFATFDMPRPEQLRMRQPRVSWRISAQPQQVCASLQPQDGTSTWQDSCATWHLASNQCTVVTTANTSHSVLGHLFLSCLTARSKP
jgi:hypothetical protein